MRPTYRKLRHPEGVPNKDPSPWNTLEASKLFVSSATAFAIAFAGWQINRTSTEQAAQRVRQEKVFDRRADVWAQVAHSLTQLHQIQEIIHSQGIGSLHLPDELRDAERKNYDEFMNKSELVEDAFPYFSKQTILCLAGFSDASSFFHSDIEENEGKPGWRNELGHASGTCIFS